MLAILIALCLSEDNIVGGWQTIPVDHERVQNVKQYLDRNMPHLFPEIANGGYVVASAKMQIVSGYNLKLSIKANSSPLMFELSLYINVQNKVALQGITRPVGSKPILGGYSWQNPSHFTAQDLAHTVSLIQRKVNLLLKSQGEVMVYRTKVEKGLKTHVVFRDTNKNIFSAVTIKDPNSNSEDLVMANQIF